MVPRASSCHFTGRKELAKRLTRAFSRDHSTQLHKQKVFVISDIGGTGKSEVCLKFADDHLDE